MKKAISLITSILCALSCLTMAGCGKKKTSEVYFLNFKPESATVYEELAKKYEEEKGVKVTRRRKRLRADLKVRNCKI